jgi:hypothetical protein
MCLHEQVRATESSVAVELLTTKPPTEAASRRPDGDPDGGMSERGLSGMIRVLDRRCKLPSPNWGGGPTGNCLFLATFCRDRRASDGDRGTAECGASGWRKRSALTLAAMGWRRKRRSLWRAAFLVCRPRAKKRHRAPHSITSSANASKFGGNSSPIDFAVFKLTTNT